MWQVEHNNILYRRQFFLSSKDYNMFPSWNKKTIGGKYYISSHPDLSIEQVSINKMEATLLGYVIDPDNPFHGNNDILSCLLQKVCNSNDVIYHTHKFGGRWILIICTGNKIILFNDPSGLRSVYYTVPEFEPFCCSSQPGMIAKVLKLNYSIEANKEYLLSSYYNKDIEYWWPSGVSLYKEVKHLVPNHYLDLYNAKAYRFWPFKKLDKWSIQDAATQVADILQKHMIAVANRYTLALPVTAGIDSRAILGASLPVSQDVLYYTLIYYNLSLKSADIYIPNRILSRLRLNHQIFTCYCPMPVEYRNVYLENVDQAHTAWGDIAYNVSKYKNLSERVCVKGVCSEIARPNDWEIECTKIPSGKNFAKMNGMQDNLFSIKYFQEWFDNCVSIVKDCNMYIRDLYFWEHRMGSWQSMSQLEWDIVQEEFTPFNCRHILEIMLGVDISDRSAPYYKLHREIIKKYSPNLLYEPINPKPWPISIVHTLEPLLKKTKIWSISYNAYRLVKNKSFC